MLKKVEAGCIYRNIKTQTLYRVIAIAKHSETEELMVVYHKKDEYVWDLDMWVRPISLFKEKFEEPQNEN